MLSPRALPRFAPHLSLLSLLVIGLAATTMMGCDSVAIEDLFDKVRDSGVASPPGSCATIDCAVGTHCEEQQVMCIKAPCPPLPTCVPDTSKLFCGGIGAIVCPGDGQCVDDPSDTCDPKGSGRDCGGVCQCVQKVDCAKSQTFDSSVKVCACVPAPVVCGPVCDIYCEYGNVLDAQGCPTCQCNKAPAPPKS